MLTTTWYAVALRMRVQHALNYLSSERSGGVSCGAYPHALIHMLMPPVFIDTAVAMPFLWCCVEHH